MDFINEFLKRFLAEKPQFFKIAQKILAITLAIGLIPSALDWLCANAGLCDFLPDKAAAIVGKVVSISAAVGMFIAQLTVTSDAKTKLGIDDKKK